MTKYIVKRVLFGLVTLFALATITFYHDARHSGHSLLQGRCGRLVGRRARDKLIELYDLDKPLIDIQYHQVSEKCA